MLKAFRQWLGSQGFIFCAGLVLSCLNLVILAHADIEPRELANNSEVDQTARQIEEAIQTAQQQSAGSYTVEILHLKGQTDNPHLRRLIEQLYRKGIQVKLDLVDADTFETEAAEVAADVEQADHDHSGYLLTYSKEKWSLSNALTSVRDSFRRVLGTANGMSFFKFLRDVHPVTGKKEWKFKHDPSWFKMALLTTAWAETSYGLVLKFALGLPVDGASFIRSMLVFPILVFPILYQKDILNKIRLQGVTVLLKPNATEAEAPLIIRENKIFYTLANFIEYLNNGLFLMSMSGGLTANPTQGSFIKALAGNGFNTLVNSVACTTASVPAEYITALCQRSARNTPPEEMGQLSELIDQITKLNNEIQDEKTLEPRRQELKLQMIAELQQRLKQLPSTRSSSWALKTQYIYWNLVFPIFRNMGLLYQQIADHLGLKSGASAALQLPFPALGLVGAAVDIKRSWGQYIPAFKAILQNLGVWGEGASCRNLVRVKKQTVDESPQAPAS